MNNLLYKFRTSVCACAFCTSPCLATQRCRARRLFSVLITIYWSVKENIGKYYFFLFLCLNQESCNKTQNTISKLIDPNSKHEVLSRIILEYNFELGHRLPKIDTMFWKHNYSWFSMFDFMAGLAILAKVDLQAKAKVFPTAQKEDVYFGS